MKNHDYYVYILTQEKNGVFYVGVTNDLIRLIQDRCLPAKFSSADVIKK
jgi:predicted GIY-YIG superfamily endonuclease